MLAKRSLIGAAALSAGVACSSGGSNDAPLAASGAGNASGGAGNGAGAAGTTPGGMGGLGAQTGGMGADTGDAKLIVPEGIEVSALAGGSGVFDMLALTVRKGPTGTEIYAALQHHGDAPACDAALSVELYDKAQQSLTAGIGAMQSNQLFALTDGSGNAASCVAPGAVTMAALTGLPAEIVLEDLGFAVFRCSYFALEVTPVPGLAVSGVQSATQSAGTAYTGNFDNGLTVAVNTPSVTLFPVNRVGRPLGAATASSPDSIAPGSSWAFQTNTVDTPGVDVVAFPAGSIDLPPSE